MTRGERVAVAAGILVDADGRILLSECSGRSAFAGLWEFPGGKLRPGETAREALVRELDEELGIAVLDAGHFMSLEHDYEHLSVALEFYRVLRYSGTPSGRDGQALAWRHPAAIDARDLLPADGPVLTALQKEGLRGVSRRSAES